MKKFLIAIFFSIIAPAAAEQRYPAHANVIDVTKPPWSAKGDGVTDDTEALQAALNEHVGRHHVLWFPRGTYLISKSLTWPKEWSGHQKWGFTMLRGEERDSTIIRLKDDTFIKHFGHLGGGIEIATRRAVVLRSLEALGCRL